MPAPFRSFFFRFAAHAWLLAFGGLSLYGQASAPAPRPPVIFEQDFTRSSKVGDYFSPQAGDHQFDDISAAPNGGTWSIVEGKLRIERESEAGTAGIARTTPLTQNPAAIEFRFDFSLEASTDLWGGSPLEIDIGEWKKPITSENPGSYDYLFTRIGVQLSKTGEFRLRVGDKAADGFHADGTPYSVVVAVNGSGGDLTYAGPDGRSHTIGDRNVSMWVNDSIVLENVSRGGFRCDLLSSFRVRMTTSSAVIVQFEKFAISDLTPP